MTNEPVYAQRVGEFRATRERIEHSILPLASSVDGRTFRFQASAYALPAQVGGYVVLDGTGGGRLGQVTALELEHDEVGTLGFEGSDGTARVESRLIVRLARGSGALLEGNLEPFHDATVRAATSDELRAWLDRAAAPRAQLQIGDLALAEGVPYSLDAGGFGRHTFLCGQSGSGKTYALGLILERLLLDTDLRVVVLDPNSDYTQMARVRKGTERGLARRYRAAAAGVVVRRGTRGPGRLAVRMADLDPAVQAAMLRLDPVDDRAEYADLISLVHDGRVGSVSDLAAAAGGTGLPIIHRASNLGVLDWGVWSRPGGPSFIDDLLDGDARFLVADLGSLPSREEQALAATATLNALWRRRADRRPVLIVIDEAHNVCPAVPEDAVTAIAANTAVRIAAEGRKFGLYLLVATQRPQKVQENVVTQCDNLILMRMNSLGDLAFAHAAFSFVPSSLMDRATTFRLGEAIVAGKISPHPAIVRMGRRVAEEGGADVPATWARPAY
jgi:DNA helicase HerA-like ATPase